MKGTSDYGLHLRPSSQLNLYNYCDTDWGVSHEDRKPILCVFLGNSIISWSSKRQNVVSRSSTELVYLAVADVVAELTWISSLMKELQCPIVELAVIWSDNMGADSSTNLIYHSRTKHVEIDVHFIRDKVAANEVSVRYVPTYEQTVYCLTKALTTNRLIFLRDKLGVVRVPTSLRGGVRI